MKIVINACFGGFSLSEKAYEKLIEWGIPVKKYVEQERDPNTGLYLPQPKNDGEVIFDRTLESDNLSQSMISLSGRYWNAWIEKNRTHPLLIRLVEELGSDVNGKYANLKIVDIPDDVEWEISEYDGWERVEEKHRSWG